MTKYVWWIAGAWVVWSLLQRRNLPLISTNRIPNDPQVNTLGATPNWVGADGQTSRWA